MDQLENGRAIERLYRTHREPLLIWFTRRTGDPHIACDLWAETFAQAARNYPSLRGRSEIETAGWLYRIAKNQLAFYYRRGKAEDRALRALRLERPVLSEDLIDELSRSADLEELRDSLSQAMAALSDRNRRAVEMRIVEQLPYPAVAAGLRITEEAARARVARGLASLRSHLLTTEGTGR